MTPFPVGSSGDLSIDRVAVVDSSVCLTLCDMDPHHLTYCTLNGDVMGGGEMKISSTAVFRNVVVVLRYMGVALGSFFLVLRYLVSMMINVFRNCVCMIRRSKMKC